MSLRTQEPESCASTYSATRPASRRGYHPRRFPPKVSGTTASLSRDGRLEAVGLAQQFERRLEALVEGVFSRTSRAGVEPLELARKLQRAMGADRRVGLRGEVLAPNSFTAAMSPEDHQRFVAVEDALRAEIATMLRSHADEEGWGLMGPVEVELLPDPGVRRGRVEVRAGYKQAEGPTGGTLVLADGRSIPLRGERMVIGRLRNARSR